MYTAEQLEPVFAEIATSDAGTQKTVQKHGLAIRSFYDTLEANPELSQKYTRAKELQAHFLAEQILEIADDGSNDWMLTHDPENPGYILNGEHTRRSNMRIEARKWTAAKLLPRKYGDKLDVTSNGETLKQYINIDTEKV